MGRIPSDPRMAHVLAGALLGAAVVGTGRSLCLMPQLLRCQDLAAMELRYPETLSEPANPRIIEINFTMLIADGRHVQDRALTLCTSIPSSSSLLSCTAEISADISSLSRLLYRAPVLADPFPLYKLPEGLCKNEPSGACKHMHIPNTWYCCVGSPLISWLLNNSYHF